MSATTIAPAPRRHTATLPATPVRAGFGGALRSEWTKIRTVRSTWWTLLAATALNIGVSVLITYGTVGHDSVAELRQHDLVAGSMNGLILGQLAMVVFGALAITGEYSTGMIRTSFTSMPRRTLVLGAKALVTAAVALAVGLVSAFTSFFVCAAVYSGRGAHVAIGDPNALRAVIGGGLYLAGTAVLAFGLGLVLRHTAAAITTAVGALFISVMIVNFLPTSWQDTLAKWLPMNAGAQIISTRQDDHMFTAWVGFGVFAAYAAVAVVAGFLLARKRDA